MATLSVLSLSLAGGCAKASYCLRPGAIPDASMPLSVGDKERVVIARDMVRRLQTAQSPETRAALLTGLPTFFPSTVPQCTTEFVQLLHSNYFKGASTAPWRVDLVTLAAIDALSQLRGGRLFAEEQGQALMSLYKRPLAQNPYVSLPHGRAYPPQAIPDEADIRLRIARALARTMSVYHSQEYRAFLLSEVALDAPVSTRLALAHQVDAALERGSKQQATHVMRQWIAQLKGAMNEPLRELDSLNLYVEMLNSLATHATSLGMHNEVEALILEMSQGLASSAMSESMSTSALANALHRARVVLMRNAVMKPGAPQAPVP